MISSTVLPALNALLMRRRGFRFVLEAFKPTLTSSMNLMGKIPSIHGFVVIFTVGSAQAGSHSLSWFRAAAQRLTGC